jgi:hypothetical protein
MDFVNILKNAVPEAGPKAQQSILDAQRRLELLRVKNPEEADIFSRQLAGAITNRQDPSEILAGIGKSYGMSVGRPVSKVEQSQEEDTARKQAFSAATIAEINSLMGRSKQGGQQVDQGLADSIISLAQSDPETARRMARESIPVAPPLSVGDQIALEKRAEEKLMQQQTASNVADKSTRMVELMTELQTHPGFENLFGATAWPTWISGSPGADAKALLKQIDALGFMESIKDMKGMGALSNAEGEKASAAFVGITPDMSEDAARKKITEVIGYIQKGQQRIQSGNLIETKENKGPSISGANSYFNQYKPPAR